MKFADDYSCIVSGTVYSVGATEEEDEDSSPHRQLMSRYGEGLLYCNAGLWDTLVHQYNNSSSSSDNNNERNDIRRVFRNIEQQLIRQGATPALVRMMSTVHLAAWHGDPSPMEYI